MLRSQNVCLREMRFVVVVETSREPGAVIGQIHVAVVNNIPAHLCLQRAFVCACRAATKKSVEEESLVRVAVDLCVVEVLWDTACRCCGLPANVMGSSPHIGANSEKNKNKKEG